MKRIAILFFIFVLPLCTLISFVSAEEQYRRYKIINDTPNLQKFYITKQDLFDVSYGNESTEEHKLRSQDALNYILKRRSGRYNTIHFTLYPPNNAPPHYDGCPSYRIKLAMKSGENNYLSDLIKEAQGYRKETKETESRWLFQPPYVW